MSGYGYGRGARSATTERGAEGPKRSAVGEGASGRAREYRLLQCVVVRVSVTVYVCACVRAYVRTYGLMYSNNNSNNNM